jgi:glycosyltransferase involved in cell wall biosynthesis
VVRHGYLPHADSIALMRSADLLFLPLHNLPSGTRATIVPGKTYEYLASGTPILGALPPGDAKDVLLEAGNATVVPPDDVDGMATAILMALEGPGGDGPRQPRADVVARFEYRRLAADLARLFDGVLEPGTSSALAPHGGPEPAAASSIR